jgi:ATP-dependent Clp protease ATP-binding subunit ClpA
MARVIQEHIKKPLADEVLFGQLKGGGHVRVVLVTDDATARDKIGFEFVEGPVTPKPEKLPGARKRTVPRKPKPPGGSNGGGGSKAPPSRGPLVKV